MVLAARFRRLSVSALAWTPVAAALVLFGQIALLGLRPALSESRALERKAVVLERRCATAEERLRKANAWLRAQADPVYRERVRRALMDPRRAR
jgi:hypothetical protein